MDPKLTPHQKKALKQYVARLISNANENNQSPLWYSTSYCEKHSEYVISIHCVRGAINPIRLPLKVAVNFTIKLLEKEYDLIEYTEENRLNRLPILKDMKELEERMDELKSINWFYADEPLPVVHIYTLTEYGQLQFIFISRFTVDEFLMDAQDVDDAIKLLQDKYGLSTELDPK